MKKRVFAILAALALGIAPVPAAAASPLDTADDWAVARIEDAVSKGFVPTDIQDNYKNVITRLEFCRMAVKWMEYATGKNIDALLADNGVSREHGAFGDTSDPDILAAYALGVISGEVAPSALAPGVFNPGGGFTRQQAAVMVTNTCKAIGANTRNPVAADFEDMDLAASWAVGGINFARVNGIMDGVTSEPPYLFDPPGAFTRQESILLLNNIEPANLPVGSGPIPVRVMPGAGGDARVFGVTNFSFSPNQGGMWSFRTSDCGEYDPYLELYDSNGELVVQGDDQLDTDVNALIYANLSASEEYRLVAKFYPDSVTTGRYTLTAARIGVIPERGGNVNVNGPAGFAFTPDRSGLWNFRTSYNGTSDPQLILFSLYDGKVEVHFVNDDGGDGANAIMTPFIRAGETYFIDACFWGDEGSYALSVSPPVVFSGSGGHVRVNGPTGFALTPYQSGIWDFRVTDFGIYSPYIVVFDSKGGIIVASDIIYSGIEVVVSARLTAGEQYFLHAGELYEDYKLPACSFDLTVNNR